jgi:hypothetical protein
MNAPGVRGLALALAGLLALLATAPVLAQNASRRMRADVTRCTTTITQIVPSNPSRVGLLIQNVDPSTAVYLHGAATLNSERSMLLHAGSTLTLNNFSGDLFCVTAADGVTIRWSEETQ